MITMFGIIGYMAGIIGCIYAALLLPFAFILGLLGFWIGGTVGAVIGVVLGLLIQVGLIQGEME